ncbi:MAG: hypothetical protein GY771_00485 [bacterium]|nr:hypothetical protein [bacterium]
MNKRICLQAILIVAVLLLSSGCYYGTFQSPKGIGMGKVRVRTAGYFPAYFASSDRESAEKLGRDFGDGMIKGMVTYGGSKRFDIGLQGSLYSLGLHAKWWAVMSPESGRKSVDFAPMIWLDYFWEMKRITPKFSLIAGYPTSRIGELYLGYEGFWGPRIPTMLKIDGFDGSENGKYTWDLVKDQVEYQDSIFLGFDIEFSSIAFTAEIGYPLQPAYQEHPVIFFGIGIGGDIPGLGSIF